MRIEAWAFGTGTDQFAADGTITINGNDYSLSIPLPFGEALDQLMATAGVGEGQPFAWELVDGAVRIYSSGAAFDLQCNGAMAAMLGTGTDLATGSNSYLFAALPGGRHELLACELDVRTPADVVEMQIFRHGRSQARSFGSYDAQRITAYYFARPTRDEPFLRGSRIRVWPTDDGTPYDLNAPGGWFDGYVLNSQLRDHSDDGSLQQLTLTLLVPREG